MGYKVFATEIQSQFKFGKRFSSNAKKKNESKVSGQIFVNSIMFNCNVCVSINLACFFEL